MRRAASALRCGGIRPYVLLRCRALHSVPGSCLCPGRTCRPRCPSGSSWAAHRSGTGAAGRIGVYEARHQLRTKVTWRQFSAYRERTKQMTVLTRGLLTCSSCLCPGMRLNSFMCLRAATPSTSSMAARPAAAAARAIRRPADTAMKSLLGSLERPSSAPAAGLTHHAGEGDAWSSTEACQQPTPTPRFVDQHRGLSLLFFLLSRSREGSPSGVDGRLCIPQGSHAGPVLRRGVGS